MTRRTLALSGSSAFMAMALFTGTAVAVDGQLPGGTAISVTIDSPADNTVFPQGPVTVEGTASVGEAAVVKDTALTYVVDVSGSTAASCDGSARTVLQCEVQASQALNALAADPASPVGTVGAVIFGSSAAVADVRPADGDQVLTGPATDDNSNGTRDVEEVLGSMSQGHVGEFSERDVVTGTYFPDAVVKATTVTDAQNESRKIVAFLSDGASIGDVNSALDAVPANVDIHTFAVGTGSACQSGPYSDSLQLIADRTGGECTHVPDPANLPDVLPDLLASELSSLTASVDGGPAAPVTAISPGLPQNGPATVDYSYATGPLASGTHEICVTAHGEDNGGNGSVTDCVTVIVNDPPTVDPSGPYAGQEGTPVAIAGLVTDPDGPNLTTTWTATPASGVDAGATCAFADASAVDTTVTCTDDGVWTLRLTADDGLNPPVSATADLTLTNVAPSVTVADPADGTLVLRGTPVTVTAPFTDIATNDTHTCSVDFDDGSAPVTGTVDQGAGSGSCAAEHTYTGVGAHLVVVTVTDDDGGSATAVVKLVSYVRAEAWGISASGVITVSKTPHATCPPNSDLTTASLSVPGLATVQALHAECTLDPSTGHTDAAAEISGANLLGGAIRLTDIETRCVATESGLSGSSRVGTLNGQPIGTAPTTVSIPLVATVYLNQTVNGPNGQLAQYSVRVVTLLGQEIVLSGCRMGF
ncbi:choice-of-anchor P family protein [Actinophytocola sp. NPDC049390]|uniref:choice-of-anchor P family protein n=1 Tax=Actinophytocola sp. NPDC049390 TaxID=3363894 RepID=UPI0037A56EED